MVKDCLLEEGVRYCQEHCWRCGWSKDEVRHREKLFKQNGLTKTKNGLEKLIITREESEDK